MAEITLRVLDGAERGRIYDQLPTPVTIGREEGNTIQLNDERISRFHIKIQEDHDKIVLTDLESTNGTKVNGEDIQLRILRFGDMIAVGRSVLLYGSQEQIGHRLNELKARRAVADSAPSADLSEPVDRSQSLDFDLNWAADPDVRAALTVMEPPEIPERLTAGQAAQLSELLEYLHLRMRYLLETVKMDKRGERISLDAHQWQSLLDLQAQISRYLRLVGEPGED